MTNVEAVRGLVIRHRAHFELVAAEGYEGWALTLFGAHRPGQHALPGGAASLDIFCDLEHVARALVPADDPAHEPHVARFNGRLLDASELRSEHVSLVLELRPRPGASARAQARSLARVRGRLAALGLREGAGGEAAAGAAAASLSACA